MKLLTLMLLAFPLIGQVNLDFSTGSTVKVGQPGSRDITITSSNGQVPSAVQFTLNWTPTIISVALSAGASATTAGKTLTCSTIITNADSTLSQACVVDGFNNNTIPNGVLVHINFVAANTTTLSGTFKFPPTPVGLLSASAAANPFQVTGGTTTIPFVLPGDLNGDGLITSTDLSLLWSQILGACTTGDMNGDGKCDVVDARLLSMAAGH